MVTAERQISGSRFLVEPATRDDDAELRELFRKVSMGSGIEVCFEREPSYFDALTIQGERSEVGVIRDVVEGGIVGCGTRVMRQGFINGQLVNLGYLGDLRIKPSHRNRTLTARIFRSFQKRESWCDWYYTVIFDENIKALNSIAAGRAGLPIYRDQGRILCPGIELRQEIPRLSVKGVSLRSGTHDDLQQIVDCLNRNLARKQFAPFHKLDDFHHGQRWRGLKVEDFIVAEKEGKIVGVMAAWDQSSFKQTRIVGYHGVWQWLAPLSRIVSPFRRAPGLPPKGEYLSYLYVCCTAVDGDDIDIFRVLLREIYNANVGKEWLYFMIGLHERDPFAAVLGEYARIPFAGRLFSVSLTDPSGQSPVLDDRIPYIEVSTL